MPVAYSHVALSLQSLEHHKKKESFRGWQLRSRSTEKIGARHIGRLFNTSSDKVKHEIRLHVSLYLDELLD